MAHKLSSGATSRPASTLRTRPTRSSDLTANLEADLKDNGLTQFPLGHPKYIPKFVFTGPSFANRETEDQYLNLLQDKLTLAREFVLVEIEHNLDSNRNTSRDKTAMLLAKEPIAFTLYAQECIRDLVILRSKLIDCRDAKQDEDRRIRKLQQNEVGDDAATLRKKFTEVVQAQGITESKIQQLGDDHIWAWNELGAILEYMLPVAPAEYKEHNAELIMNDVFGENLVYEGADEEVEKEVGGFVAV